MQLVVQMHGEPGSGKSTVARELAPLIRAVVLDKDVTKAALLRSGVDEAAAAGVAYEIHFSQADELVRLGHSVVLDSPVFWPAVERRWLEVARRAGSPAILIECACPDVAERERRLATRAALESQPRERLDLRRHAGAAPTGFQPRVVLDTSRAPRETASEALRYIEQALAAAAGTAAPGAPHLPYHPAPPSPIFGRGGQGGEGP